MIGSRLELSGSATFKPPHNCYVGKTERGNHVQVLWECSKAFPFWRHVLNFVGQYLKCDLPFSQKRLCPLGDRGVLPQLDKSVMRVLMIGLVTSAKI